MFFLGKNTWNFVLNLVLSLIVTSIQMFFKSLPIHVQNKVHDMFWTLFYMLFYLWTWNLSNNDLYSKSTKILLRHCQFTKKKTNNIWQYPKKIYALTHPLFHFYGKKLKIFLQNYYMNYYMNRDFFSFTITSLGTWPSWIRKSGLEARGTR